MTDAAMGADAPHRSAASSARAKRRRRAETRLKLMGMIAIGLAAAALVTLLWSVFEKAGYALQESYLTIPVTLSAEEIDPADPGAANYNAIVKDALKAAFPEAADRSARRDLYDIVSGGAQFELRESLIADPAPIGGEIDYRFLASDDVDLYLQGAYGRLRVQDTSGILGIVGDYAKSGAEIELLSGANDFNAELAFVKTNLLARAERLRAQAAREDRGRRVFEARADDAANDAERDDLLASASGYVVKRDALLAQAEELERRAREPGGQEIMTPEMPSVLVEIAGGWVKATSVSADRLAGEVYKPLESGAEAQPGDWTLHVMDAPEVARKVSDHQLVWIEELKREGAVERIFNWRFFSAGDSREAELAGVWGAVVGSFFTMIVTFLLAFPLGVLAAIYLEEFAPKNKLTDFVEVNINNLAAVPSIIFGLLGLAVALPLMNQLYGVSLRSAPLIGGLVLALMTLPTIIIASRAAIRAVPPSIRDAALGVGASKVQTSFHHVLPLAMPGILTGSIIGMAQALGETAPLIMIGMVAFIVDIPQGITDSATVLPVQIYRWSDFPERAFEAKTALAICVLLGFLVIMNIIAIVLRKRFERRW